MGATGTLVSQGTCVAVRSKLTTGSREWSIYSAEGSHFAGLSLNPDPNTATNQVDVALLGGSQLVDLDLKSVQHTRDPHKERHRFLRD